MPFSLGADPEEECRQTTQKVMFLLAGGRVRMSLEIDGVAYAGFKDACPSGFQLAW